MEAEEKKTNRRDQADLGCLAAQQHVGEAPDHAIGVQRRQFVFLLVRFRLRLDSLLHGRRRLHRASSRLRRGALDDANAQERQLVLGARLEVRAELTSFEARLDEEEGRRAR